MDIILPKEGSRTITLSYTIDESTEVSQLLQKIQLEKGIRSETIKGLFLEILRNSLNSTEIQNLETNSSEELEDAHTEINRLSIELQKSNGVILERDQKIQELNELVETLGSIEVDEKEIEPEIQLKANEILLSLSDDQLTILDAIAKNRFNKGVDKEQKSRSEIIIHFMFNRATLFNWSGEIYTGL